MKRADRNKNGEFIMYADKITDAMRLPIDETNRRNEIQMIYNEKHGITPTTIKKEVRDVNRATVAAEDTAAYGKNEINLTNLKRKEKEKAIKNMEKEMKEAAKSLNFEKAAELRDIILELKAGG